jgi:triacylglycerol lipase
MLMEMKMSPAPGVDFNARQVAAARAALGWHSSDLPTLRAAYSDRTAALMAFFAAFAYEEVTMPGSAPVTPKLVEMGFQALTYYNNGLTDGWALVAESPAIVVIAFRGTASWTNWETNINALLEHPSDTDAKLMVHRGFERAFQGLADNGLTAKVKVIQAATDGQVPIYITGHSLGGALAQIAAAVIGGDDIAACYTFGSPRVGNAYFDLWVKAPSYRVVNHADIVPQVPPALLYRHSGDPRYLPKVANASPYRFQPNLPMRVATLSWDHPARQGTNGIGDR